MLIAGIQNKKIIYVLGVWHMLSNVVSNVDLKSKLSIKWQKSRKVNKIDKISNIVILLHDD